MSPEVEKLIAEMRSARRSLAEKLDNVEGFRALAKLDEPGAVIDQADARRRLKSELATVPEFVALERLEDAIAVLEGPVAADAPATILNSISRVVRDAAPAADIGAETEAVGIADSQSSVEDRYLTAIRAAEPDRFTLAVLDGAEGGIGPPPRDEGEDAALAPAMTFRELSEATVEIERSPLTPLRHTETESGEENFPSAGSRPAGDNGPVPDGEVLPSDATQGCESAFHVHPGEIPEASGQIVRGRADRAEANQAGTPGDIAPSIRATDRAGLVKRFVRVLRGDGP